jgi:hypothetical protein
MTNDEKEILRIRYDDLSTDLQKRIDSVIHNNTEIWNTLVETINNIFEIIDYNKKNYIDKVKKLVNITVNNTDTSLQHILITVEGNTYIDPTSFSCYNTSRYLIQIFPAAFYKAGECSVPLNGFFDDDTEVVIQPATPIIDIDGSDGSGSDGSGSEGKTTSYEYDINILIGKHPLRLRYGLQGKQVWSSASITAYGELIPDDVLDAIWINLENNTYSSSIAFYGDTPVTSLFNTISIYFIMPDNTQYTILENGSSNLFNKYGDLTNSCINNKEWYDRLVSLVGQWCTLKIIISK